MLLFSTRAAALFAATFAFTAFGGICLADDTQDAIRQLQHQVGDLQKQMKQKDREIDALKKVKHDDDDHDAGRHGEHHEEHAEHGPLDISLAVLFAVGTSSERDDVIQQLQGGGHDPNRRGFTLQQVELSVGGEISEHLYGKALMVLFVDPEGETVVELEEATLQSMDWPGGFEFETGFILTEFGLINPRHPHHWDWLDQPVIHSRVFGPDGLRQAGVRFAQSSPDRKFGTWHLGMQQASGETTQSFLANDEVYDPAEEDRSIGGLAFVDQETRSGSDFLYSARWVNGWDLGGETHAQFGASALFGPNASGARGETLIYGIDFTIERPGPGPHGAGWIWQTEWIQRAFDVDASNANFVTRDLEDWGFYTQMLCWLDRHWAAGLRYEMAGGEGANSDPAAPGTPISRDTDPFRADRYRISPLITYAPNASTRYRLQYNHDNASHIADTAHTVWFGVEFVLGAH